MKYQEAVEYIEDLSKYGIKPGLDTIKELCRRVGNPQDDLQFVHIAGSNGKGSTLAFVSTILKCAGYKVGRYISPTIFEYRERIQVGERPISRKRLCELTEQLKAVCEEMVADGFHHPTPFEFETAMAFLYFKEMVVDIVVLETGMGGRGDATNLITTTKVAVLASISMDHMQYLGDTLEKIAWEKAGIIKEGCLVVSQRQEAAAAGMIQRECEEKRAELTFVEPEKLKKVRSSLSGQKFNYGKYKDLQILLLGTYQIENAMLAVEVAEALGRCGFVIAEDALYKGLKETKWLGRFSVISKKPYFIVDGAHNEDGAKKLAESIAFYFTNKRIIYIMGILRDKEYEKIIELTAKYADQIITVKTPSNSRAMDSYELASEVAKVHPSVTAAASLEEAVELAYLLAGKDDVILSFGSLSYLGAMIKLVENR
ncbi:MAG: bifunctional folylpolyglutamate synthase/dihydrofolate synthase [Lachnospiraceae bacterium]|nr:bifunctional folylpolyglutamate synthase/dihydrofolate synthase [Lachnospiraceae bacterium]